MKSRRELARHEIVLDRGRVALGAACRSRPRPASRPRPPRPAVTARFAGLVGSGTSAPPASLTNLPVPPLPPPNMPHGRLMKRSPWPENVMVWPTGRTTRRRPSPPRCFPAPPESGDEAVALDQQRIFHLDRFHRQIRRVGDVHLHAVLAVLGEAPAEAAAERFEIDVVAVVARIVAEEHRRGVRAVRGADRGLGDRGRERADHDVDDALRRVGARRDGRREFRVDAASRAARRCRRARSGPDCSARPDRAAP